MRQRKRRFKEEGFANEEFAEALYEDSGHRSSDQRARYKTQQFCRQVQRALNLALSDIDAIDGVGGLFVEEVSPAPDCGRLLVHVLIPANRPAADALGVLRREASRLRAEVATAITRKRAPELAFAPALSGGGTDE